MANLRVLRDGVELHNLDLAKIGKPTIVVGRAPEADVRIDDRAIGREHVVISLGERGLLIQKKTKFGKVSLNGVEINDGVIKAGDVIAIADYLMRIEETVVPVKESGFALANAAPLALAGDSRAADPKEPLALDGATEEAQPVGLEVSNTEQQNSGTGPALEKPPEPSLSMNETGEAQVPVGEPLPQADAAVGATGDDRTAIISTAQVLTKLVFKPGDANVEELVIKKPEITIGRATNCDVVLNDKKSSRTHLIIVRAGMNFVAKDQGSANGTYINGVRINEQELAGDDILRIGSTEFTFMAQSQDYMAHEQEYVSPSAESLEERQTDPGQALGGDLALQQGQLPMDPNAGAINPATPDPGLEGLNQAATVPGLGQPSNKKESLLEKFRRQPTPRKIIIGAMAALGLWMLLDDEPDASKKKVDPAAKPAPIAEKADAAFNALPKEKKEFVINTYNLALDYYKGQQYEKAVYEVSKLIEVLPGGYKDAMEIKRYAEKSIEMVKAQEDEKHRKEQEEKLKVEIAELVAKATSLVEKGKEQEAKDVFSQVLEKDPDNPTILRLRQQLEEKEQRLKAEAETQRENDFKRKQLQSLISDGHALVKAGKYYEAIEKMKEAPVIYAGDQKLLDEAKEIIAEAKSTLKSRLDPLIAEGKRAIEDSNYTGARDAFLKALKIDSKSLEAQKGLSKIREILHTRAKRIYIDAILTESTNDYRAAKLKYKECLELAMPEDIYFVRCQAKYKRLEFLDRTDEVGPQRAAAADSGKKAAAQDLDPQLPQLPKHVGAEDEGDEDEKDENDKK